MEPVKKANLVCSCASVCATTAAKAASPRATRSSCLSTCARTCKEHHTRVNGNQTHPIKVANLKLDHLERA
eukprot:3619608-Pyramimonas_sp.AAC.1